MQLLAQTEPNFRAAYEEEVLWKSRQVENVGLNLQANLVTGSPFFVYCQKIVDVVKKIIAGSQSQSGVPNHDQCSEAVQIAFDCFHLLPICTGLMACMERYANDIEQSSQVFPDNWPEYHCNARVEAHFGILKNQVLDGKLRQAPCQFIARYYNYTDQLLEGEGLKLRTGVDLTKDKVKRALIGKNGEEKGKSTEAPTAVEMKHGETKESRKEALRKEVEEFEANEDECIIEPADDVVFTGITAEQYEDLLRDLNTSENIDEEMKKLVFAEVVCSNVASPRNEQRSPADEVADNGLEGSELFTFPLGYNVCASPEVTGNGGTEEKDGGQKVQEPDPTTVTGPDVPLELEEQLEEEVLSTENSDPKTAAQAGPEHPPDSASDRVFEVWDKVKAKDRKKFSYMSELGQKAAATAFMENRTEKGSLDEKGERLKRKKNKRDEKAAEKKGNLLKEQKFAGRTGKAKAMRPNITVPMPMSRKGVVGAGKTKGYTEKAELEALRNSRAVDYSLPVDNVEAKNLLHSEKAFTEGRIAERAVWIPLETEVNEEDRNDICRMMAMMSTSVVDLAMDILRREYPLTVGNPCSAAVGPRLPPLLTPEDNLVQIAWSPSPHFYVVTNKAEKTTEGFLVLAAIDSLAHRNLESKEAHGKTNGFVCDTVASLLHGHAEQKVYVRYLPGALQNGSKACAAFSSLNAALFCLVENGHMPQQMVHLVAKQQPSAAFDREVRIWLADFLVTENMDSVKSFFKMGNPRASLLLPIELWCHCKMPESGGMVACEARSENEHIGWTHEICLRLPWPGLQDRRFTKPRVKAKSCFYISPATYLGDRKFPMVLTDEKIEEALSYLRQEDEPENWTAPVPFQDALNLYSLSRGHSIDPVPASVLDAYCTLLASGREKVVAMPADFATVPTGGIAAATKLHGKARQFKDAETESAWKEEKVQQLKDAVGQRTQIILIPLDNVLTDQPALIVSGINHI